MPKSCSIEECERPSYSRGWCRLHYRRWYQAQCPPCQVDGCEKPGVSRGMCGMHYSRWSKHGDPLIVKHRHDGNRVDPTQSKVCAQCGDTYHPKPGRSHAQWARTEYCSATCANTWKATHSEGAGAGFKGGPEHGQKVAAGRATSPWWQGVRDRQAERLRGERHEAKHRRAQRRLDRAARGITGTRIWTAGPCLCCGSPFIGPRSSETCSKQCRRRVDRGKRKDAYGNHRERAKFYGVAYEPVKRATIFERDNYRCQLCGRKTRGTYPDPKSATLDHIVPLALGGDHVASNLQCACAACNCHKGERGGGEQLLLVG